MAVIRVSQEKVIYSFSPDHKPVVHVDAGSTILFETIDALGGQIRSESDILSEIDFSRVNPATGPVYINEAEPGDTLVVDVRDIRVEDKAVIVAGPGVGAVPDMLDNFVTRILDVKWDSVVFPGGLRIPLKPMIGVIGVAPAKESIPTGSPGPHGGNMDTSDITIGSRVYLPVNVAGGLLAIGDLHACMGDGEVCVAGAEVSGEVETIVDVIKEISFAWPIVEKRDSWMLVVSAETIDKAVYEAVKSIVKILSKGLGVPKHDAYMIASLTVDFKISQVVDPLKTVRAVVPKNILSLEKVFEAYLQE